MTNPEMIATAFFAGVAGNLAVRFIIRFLRKYL